MSDMTGPVPRSVGGRGGEAWPFGRAHFDRQPIVNLLDLFRRYPATEFESLFRPTVPLLAFATAGSALLRDVLQTCGFSDQASLHFGYRVEPVAGRALAAETDLMVREGPSWLAIGAGWMEPPTESVGDWLSQSQTNNRLQVLDGWLKLLQPQAKRIVRPADVKSVSYRAVQQAASACLRGGRPQLACLHFGSAGHATTAEWLEDLDRLHAALGRPSAFPFHLIQVEIAPASAFERIAGLSSVEVPQAIKQGLVDGSLFGFPRFKLLTLPS
jgi:hypothetical protein